MDYWKDLIQPKETELETNFGSRMDRDRAIYALEQYAMKDINGNDMHEVVNITLNYPQTFADKVVSVLSSAVTQIVAEGISDKLTKDREKAIEDCFENIIDVANNRLANMSYPDLLTYQAQRTALRIGCAQRNLIIKDPKTGKIKISIIPCDTRFFTFEMGEDGMLWGCNRSRRTKAAILADYPDAESYMPGSMTQKYDVRDFWNGDVNAIFIESHLVVEKPNPLKYPPFVVRLNNTGIHFQDEGSEAQRHESVYSALRNATKNDSGIYYELNRAISILATVAMYAAKPGYGQEVDDILNAPPLNEATKPGIGKVRAIQKGLRYEMDRLPDINQACQLYWNIMKSAFDQASLSMTEYGNTTFPMSAVALKSLSAKNDTIYLPRIQVLSSLLQASCYQLREQIGRIDGAFEIETEDRHLTYQVPEIAGTYKIGFTFFAVSPEEEVANYALANAAKSAGVSRETIFTDILKFQNPRDELEKAEAEEIAEMMPELRLYDRTLSLIEQDRDIEARQSFMAWKQVMRQKYMPAPVPGQGGGQPVVGEPQGNGSKPGSELMPLMNKDGRRAKVPAEKLPAMPEVQ